MPSLAMIKLIVGALGLLVACALSAAVTHKIDVARLDELKLSYMAAQVAAAEQARQEQAALDKISADAGAAELERQKALLSATKAKLSQVAKHVPAGKGNCITWGLIRVIDAQALDVDADILALPKGASEDGCAPVKAAALAGNIVTNYGVGRQNAQRILALQAYLRQIAAVKR